MNKISNPLLKIAKILFLGLFINSIYFSTCNSQVLVGYQGWFRCPGDGSPNNHWQHWIAGQGISQHLTVDLAPDVSELPISSRCKLPSNVKGGDEVEVFSSFSADVINIHFNWLKQYDIDGALMQRFVTNIPSLRNEDDQVLRWASLAAKRTNRVIAIEYDLSGTKQNEVLNQIQLDIKYLIEAKVIDFNSNYLQLKGKPVISLWGLGFKGGQHIDDSQEAMKLIHWLKASGFIVMGGVPGYWRTLKNDSVGEIEWQHVYEELDIIQPWTVGRYSDSKSIDDWYQNVLLPDIERTNINKQIYMPVIFPGFSWHNLKPENALNQIPRNGGQFLWKQAYNAQRSGATIIKIAMFDEVDEGTAIFKALPKINKRNLSGTWLTLNADGSELPSDWYLMVTQLISAGYQAKPLSKGLPRLDSDSYPTPPSRGKKCHDSSVVLF